MRQEAADGCDGGGGGDVAGCVPEVVDGPVGWLPDDGAPGPDDLPPPLEPVPDLPCEATSTGEDGVVPDGDADGLGLKGVDTGAAGGVVADGVLEAGADGGGEPAATGGDPGGECPNNWAPKTAPAAAIAAIALGTAL
jgi:hypothetical protein